MSTSVSPSLSEITLKADNTLHMEYLERGDAGKLGLQQKEVVVSPETYAQVQNLKAAFGEHDSMFVEASFQGNNLSSVTVNVGTVGGVRLQEKMKKAGLAEKFGPDKCDATATGWAGPRAYGSNGINEFAATAEIANRDGCVVGALKALVRRGKRSPTTPDGSKKGVVG